METDARMKVAPKMPPQRPTKTQGISSKVLHTCPTLWTWNRTSLPELNGSNDCRVMVATMAQTNDLHRVG